VSVRCERQLCLERMLASRRGAKVGRPNGLSGGKPDQGMGEEEALRKPDLHPFCRAVVHCPLQIRDLIRADLRTDAHRGHPGHSQRSAHSSRDQGTAPSEAILRTSGMATVRNGSVTDS
jgi:hypothetical protein